MTPNPNIRLQSLVHTLEQVIFPAVDPSNSLANEQCGLVLAQLRMLIRQMPYIGDYHAMCLDDIRDTIDSLPEAKGGPLTLDAAAQIRTTRDGVKDAANAAAAYQALGKALELLLRATPVDGDAEFRTVLERTAFSFARRQSVRERIWFKDAGFDPRPEELPELEQMFARDEGSAS
jgi:hypothetical protein